MGSMGLKPSRHESHSIRCLVFSGNLYVTLVHCMGQPHTDVTWPHLASGAARGPYFCPGFLFTAVCDSCWNPVSHSDGWTNLHRVNSQVIFVQCRREARGIHVPLLHPSGWQSCSIFCVTPQSEWKLTSVSLDWWFLLFYAFPVPHSCPLES